MRKLLCLAPLLLLLTGCGEPVRATDFALDTLVSVTIYRGGGEAEAREALALCKSYEAVFSPTAPDSELFRRNQGETGPLSEDLTAVLSAALDLAERSGGAFDPTVGTLSRLWNFTAEKPDVPPPEEVREALTHVDYRNLCLDGTALTLADPAAQLDLGAAAKGYIADRLRDYLVKAGVENAIIDLGGNLLCIGGRPDGKPFQIAVQQPFSGTGEAAVVLGVRDLSVVTSGVYQRCFEQDGQLYHHILDPRTGYPAETGLLSVTVLAPSSLEADLLSTACFLLGLEEGMTLAESREGVGAIFITEDGALHYSEGFDWVILS